MHDEVTRKYGLDKHTASTHLIALRDIERHTTIQKTTSQRFIPHSFMKNIRRALATLLNLYYSKRGKMLRAERSRKTTRKMPF
ncbi:MAG: hypothetical protein DRJ47_02180 [Thermoprotei archaeon]|nr:MAG: hypothetical protein DRJ47_02180 [Thermoprotei archaeon]